MDGKAEELCQVQVDGNFRLLGFLIGLLNRWLPPPARRGEPWTRFAAMLVDLDGTLMVTDTISQRVQEAIRSVSRRIPRIHCHRTEIF